MGPPYIDWKKNKYLNKNRYEHIENVWKSLHNIVRFIWIYSLILNCISLVSLFPKIWYILPKILRLRFKKHIVTCWGFAWLKWRVLDLMIEFIGLLYNLLQHFTNHYLRLDTLDLWPHYTNPLPQMNYWSRVESYVKTDNQSASLSWNKAPIWGLRPDSYYCLTVAGLWMWGSLSDDRTGLSFTTAAGPLQRSHSRVRVSWDSRPYFIVLDSRLPFSSPPTIESQSYCTLRLAVYRQSVRLGARPLET
jgi:hypothetical protein